jgi:hypothetical protein
MKQFVQKGRCFIKNHTHTIPFDPNTLDLPPQNAKFHRAQEGGEEFFGGRSTPSEKTATTASAQLQHTIEKSTPTRTLSEFTFGNKIIVKISLFRPNKVTTSW